MLSADYQRPAKLYRYSERQWLERSLTLGEFRLRPPAESLQISNLHHARGAAKRATPQLLTLSMSSSDDASLFNAFAPSDCCLVIHDTEHFGELIHRAAQRLLPNWAGIDAAVSYGQPSPLGSAFSKGKRDASQHEWLFAWRPAQATITLRPVVIQIGNIEAIAELRDRK
jgi:hypothetical protein